MCYRRRTHVEISDDALGDLLVLDGFTVTDFPLPTYTQVSESPRWLVGLGTHDHEGALELLNPIKESLTTFTGSPHECSGIGLCTRRRRSAHCCLHAHWPVRAPPSSSMVGRARLKDEADLKCYIILERIDLGLRHLTDGLSIGLLRRDESKGRASCGGEQERRRRSFEVQLGPLGNFFCYADELHTSVGRLAAHAPPPPQCCSFTVRSETLAEADLPPGPSSTERRSYCKLSSSSRQRQLYNNLKLLLLPLSVQRAQAAPSQAPRRTEVASSKREGDVEVVGSPSRRGGTHRTWRGKCRGSESSSAVSEGDTSAGERVLERCG